ncbi:hypothetical protein [Streptomyces sp. NPDC050535]|uniref:hypothetical protein n=1 Tax=Streptomyces sp. NPDC050535 TaxID=3365626 RepID=UPI0037A2685C
MFHNITVGLDGSPGSLAAVEVNEQALIGTAILAVPDGARRGATRAPRRPGWPRSQ